VTVTVIVVTLNRPDCICRCLDSLRLQEPRPDQIIVVDASLDDRTKDAVGEFDKVQYLRNSDGYGRMTASRNIGLKAAFGDVIAFVDDDAFAQDGWLENLLGTFVRFPLAGAVGGRALNRQPGEATEGKARIGRLNGSGTLHGFFAADPGQVIEVDHVMGCNMCFRRDVLAELGGFRTDYPGISGVREDSDMCLRVKKLGYRILFNPAAVVDHIGAPQAKGKRFDWRYVYYSQRNHTAMLLRNFGPQAAIVWRSVITSSAGLVLELVKRFGAAAVRFAAGSLGTARGLISGLRFWITCGSNPVRQDVEGQAIRAALQANPSKTSNDISTGSVLKN